jgi:hypothetical protein
MSLPPPVRKRKSEPKEWSKICKTGNLEKGDSTRILIIAPSGYEYREYKNWRGIPKPRRCPFCKQAKGNIRRSSGGFFGVCPNCEARGPKRGSYEEALRAWNGKELNGFKE